VGSIDKTTSYRTSTDATATVALGAHQDPLSVTWFGFDTLHSTHSVRTMSAISANSAVFARKALAGAQVASKRSAVKAKAAFNVSANAKVDACDKNSVIVSPSILSANFATLGAEVRAPPHARSRSGVPAHARPFRARALSDRRAIAPPPARGARPRPSPSTPPPNHPSIG
jgi:hypothetical protein